MSTPSKQDPIAARSEGGRTKQRVEREVRERLILRTARELFLHHGWEGFSIEGIAAAMRTSRALVYSHFPNKEEILLALAIESKIKRTRLFAHTLRFKGRARERLVAIDMMERYLAKSDIPVEILVTTARLRSRTSPKRQKELTDIELRLHLVGAGIVREAVGAGDLELPENTSPDELYFSLWSSIWGATAVERSEFPYAQAGVPAPAMTVRRGLLVMLDGYGWRPLSHELDYGRTVERVESEIFARESFKQLIAEYESGSA